jgi:hypothetical protein
MNKSENHTVFGQKLILKWESFNDKLCFLSKAAVVHPLPDIFADKNLVFHCPKTFLHYCLSLQTVFGGCKKL